MQVLNALPATVSAPLMCAYQNRTPFLQILRISNIPNWYFERVVFPSDRFLFEVMPEAQLEVYSADSSGPLCRLPCQDLKVESSLPGSS
jgi:hypothetical protein